MPKNTYTDLSTGTAWEMADSEQPSREAARKLSASPRSSGLLSSISSVFAHRRYKKAANHASNRTLAKIAHTANVKANPEANWLVGQMSNNLGGSDTLPGLELSAWYKQPADVAYKLLPLTQEARAALQIAECVHFGESFLHAMEQPVEGYGESRYDPNYIVALHAALGTTAQRGTVEPLFTPPGQSEPSRIILTESELGYTLVERHDPFYTAPALVSGWPRVVMSIIPTQVA